MKKRTLAILYALLMILSIAPISASAAGTPTVIKTNIPLKFPAVKQDPNATVVNFWSSMSGALGVSTSNLVNWFNATTGKTKKIYVKAVYQGTYDDISVKVQATIQANNIKSLPDIALLNPQGAFTLKESKYIQYVDDLAAADKTIDIKSKLNKNAVIACSYKGRMMGLPFANSVLVMHYNVNAFKSVGLDPSNPPKTFAELADASKKLLVKDSKGKISRYGLTNKLNSMWFPTFIGRQKGGKGAAFQFDQEEGRTGVPTKLVCAEDGTLKETLNEWKKVLDTGAVDYKTGSETANFYMGMTAIYLNSCVGYTTIEDYFKGMKDKSKQFEHRMARLPSVHADDGVATHVSGSAMYMFNKGDDTKKAATWEFIKFLARADVSAYWAVQSGYFPLNSDSESTDYLQAFWKKDPNTKSIFAIRSESIMNTKEQAPMIPNAGVYQTYTGDQICLLAQGKQTVDKTLTNIQKKASEVLKIWWDANS